MKLSERVFYKYSNRRSGQLLNGHYGIYARVPYIAYSDDI